MARRRTTARSLALGVLRHVEQRQGFSNRILAQQLERHPELDKRDRGFSTALVYGTLRHRRRLDAILDEVTHQPERLRGVPREIARIAAFELRELGHPAHVVSAEVGSLARMYDPARSLASFLHAIVMAVDREGAAIDDAHAVAAPLDALELRWSIPRWLAGRWIATLGPQTAVVRAEALARAPALELRVDVSRTTAMSVRERLLHDHPDARVELCPDQPQALRLVSGGDVFYGPLHEAGLVSVQGLGSQQAAIALAPEPGERVLDACAGLGVKTLQLAELMQRHGTIVAVDRSHERLEQLELVRERGSLEHHELTLRTVVGDVLERDLLADQADFDAVLLDAPCTGLGNLARHPELRWSARFEHIRERAALQTILLASLLPRVAKAGRLVYAVCSLEPEEGPAVVRNVALEHGFEITLERAWTPEQHGSDGFYLARLEHPRRV